MDGKNFELVKKGSFKVVGRRAVTLQPGGTWNVVRGDDSIKQIESLQPGSPTLGLCFGFDEKGQNDYMVAVAHSQDVENLDSYTYPEAEWLIYRAAGALSDDVLGNAWNYVNNTLLAETGLKKSGLPTIEAYVVWDEENNKCEIEIHIPYEKQ